MKPLLIFLCFLLSLNTFNICGQSNEKSKLVSPLSEKEKIEYLIKSVEDLEGAKFWRNGTWYDSKAAAAHLRMKLNKAGNRVKTAEDFISLIASKSSASGIPYRIKCSDGTEVETEVFFNKQLTKLKDK